MNFEQLKQALIGKGWSVVETSRGADFTDPDGKIFIYSGMQAVRYGSWHDVTRCMDVPIPCAKETIIITAPLGTKTRWVRQSQAEGVKLSDWVIHKVEQA
jgi:hypothetical protein